MPFAVFRRHQRKLLAVFAILAMFGFVLADTLPRLFNSGYGGPNQDPVVVELYGNPVRRSDLNEMVVQRTNANRFMAPLAGGQPIFGDISTRSMVDAMILQHEADKLRMPAGSEVGREWLKKVTNGLMNRELFEGTLRGFGNTVSGEQILSDIANQVRINNVRQLLGSPVVTPLDVFRAYRDQNERVSARAVAIPVSDFVAKVPEPAAAQLEAFYNKYKDQLPDPSRDTPGFKIPRQIRVETLSIDGIELARKIKEKLTEPELRTFYENHKAEFKKPSELPDDLFAGDPKAELTPPQVQTFDEVRTLLASMLADEQAQAEIVNRFGRVKDEVMIPFADSYHYALDDISEAKKQGEKPKVTLPTPKDLKDVAKKESLDHETTPLLTREQAERYGELGRAEVGLTPMSGGRKFAEELFDPKTLLYEPVELVEGRKRWFLARKLEDNPPRVPPLDEIRSEVAHAWKLEQARPLAEKAAQELAAEIRKAGGTIKEDTIQGRRVITTGGIPKLQPGFPIPGQMFQTGPPTPTEIPLMPDAGEALREAYFGLEQGKVAVAPDRPKNVYYVLTLKDRVPATFAELYAPNGEYFRYQFEARNDAMRRREERWLSSLRSEAGVKPGWVPSDEAERGERDPGV